MLRLITVPLQQIDNLVSESLWALSGTSQHADVPHLRGSFGLAGEAILDRSFTLMTTLLTGLPTPGAVRSAMEQVRAARSCFETRGWLDDPRSYHRDPEPPRPDQIERVPMQAWTGLSRESYDHLSFPSEFEPHPGEPGRERWLAHANNRGAHAFVLEHDEPRPWLIGVHGFGMGTPITSLPGFAVRRLHHELGLNLLLPILPYHGPRAAGRFSGREVLAPDFLQMVHLFAQATWDVRRMLGWLRERGAETVGIYGISLGAYVSSLVASFESGLECLIAGIPAVDFPTLARANEGFVMRRYDDDDLVDWRLIRTVIHPVSPLTFDPRVSPEGRFIYAGLADRVVQPNQPRALWRHWGKPEIHWFQGGHVLGVLNPTVTDFLGTALARSGMLPEA